MMNHNLFFDLDYPLPEREEVDITEIIKLRVSESLQKQGLIKSNNFLGTIEENLGYFSSVRNMFSVVGEKDANLGVFSNDVCTLFLGVTHKFISLEQFKKLSNKVDWYKFDIIEWLLVSDRPQKQSSFYLNIFSPWGLQPYGEMRWRSFKGKIVFCEIRNADGSWFINGVKQE